ncbi:GTP-binding protein, partial [Streptomyces sp900116325]|uniref:GTP-binding protein n=1 Tax=Streptomyces sp. 900116325 TaxID=3154295 RepID=UPI0033E424B9
MQYTRNMVTGASNADAALLLVDVRSGITEQTRRHAAVTAVLRVPHLTLVVNKMDLVGWAEAPYSALEEQFRQLAGELGLPDVSVVPVSALRGDNVVTSSEAMPWYRGTALLDQLEFLAPAEPAHTPVRLPVQLVLRAAEYRGYAGRVESGALTPGDEVVVLPSGARSRVKAIEAGGQPLSRAERGRSVVVRLADELDVVRGDLIAGAHAAPTPVQEISGTVCWF